MAGVQSQPDHERVLQDFYHWIGSASRPGIRGASIESNCTFVPLPQLREYFREGQKVTKLLECVFGRSWDYQVDPAVVADRFPRVFAILLLLNKGPFIQHFTHYEAHLCDKRLPFGTDDRFFPKSPQHSNFLAEFRETQWQFCAHDFKWGAVILEEEVILPIVKIEKKGEGVSAIVRKIDIHPWYNHLLSGATRDETGETSQNTFVLKTYTTPDAEEYFDREVAAFRKLNAGGSYEPIPNLIGFYGSFVQGHTYNIILEYADGGTLEDYFQKVRPPRRGHEIVTFSRNIFAVATALIKIHHQDDVLSKGQQRVRIFQGWHQDVKPANILVVNFNRQKPYDVQFKLADLGLSHFSEVVATGSDPTGEDSRGTRAYGAPECYRPKNFISDWPLKVKQSVDIWSLGCVFSEAATWMVDGMEFLGQYRERRMSASGRIEGNGFHDGVTVLPVVQEWHENDLLDTKRSEDHITPALWRDLLRHMLVKDGDTRAHAREVWRLANAIVEEAEQKLAIPPAKPSVRKSKTSAPDLPTQSVPVSPPHTPPEVPPEYQRDFSPHHGGYTTTRRMPTTLEEEPAYSRQTYNGGHNGANTNSPDSFDQQTIDSPPRVSSITAIAPLPSPITMNPRSSQDRMSGNNSFGQLQSSRPGTGYYIERGIAEISMQGATGYAENRNTQRPGGHDTFSASSDPFFDPQPHMPPVPPSAQIGESHKHQLPGSSIPQATADQAANKSVADVQGTAAKTEEKPDPRGPPPVASVATFQKWEKEVKKNGSSSLLKKDELLVRLRKRDHVFLIDDAYSMRPHWKNVQSLFGNLAYFIKKEKLDPNGSELYFTVSDEWKQAKNTTDLRDMVASKGHNLKGNSDPSWRLDWLLKKYEDKLEAYDRKMKSTRRVGWTMTGPVRCMNVYIMTDGVWQNDADCMERIKRPIRRLVHTLESVKAPADQIGLQFIQFGNNEIGTKRMTELDDKMGLARDIIDTESLDGNVWKMLLGAIDKWFDAQNADPAGESSSQ